MIVSTIQLPTQRNRTRTNRRSAKEFAGSAGKATGVRLLHLGKKPAAVAEILNVSQATVFNWHGEWRAEGIAGLRDNPRSGRPPLADEAYRAQVEALLETDPTTLGYGFTCWTLQRLITHLAQATGIEVSINTMRSVLARQDYVCRRPKHDLKPLQDATARATAKALLADLKKKPKPASVQIIDPSTGRTLQNAVLTIPSVAVACVQQPCPLLVEPVGGATILLNTILMEPVKFLNALPGSGSGEFAISPTLRLYVPASVYMGDYQVTVVVTIVSGP